jgi:UDP-N-acetylmuramate dehydrogenase
VLNPEGKKLNVLLQTLIENNVGIIKEEEILANHTTMKIGGPAKIFIEPNGISNLLKTIEIIKGANVPFRVIGRGSNLLVSDKGFDGVIVKLGKGMDHFEINGTEVLVGSGYSIVTLATVVGKKGLSGLEFAAGIPGSIGGAVYMNAGAHGSDMSKILKKAHVLFLNGDTKWLTVEEMQYSYRTSVLQKDQPGVVLECLLQLSEGNPDSISEVIQANKNYRKNTQPYNFPCAGSIFRNPLPQYAGKLVEELGLKGFTIGGAKVSDLHGNFIVNANKATAQDVLDLISYIQRQVKEKYGIDLHTEVEMLF